MLKPIMDFIKSASAAYQRFTQIEDNIKNSKNAPTDMTQARTKPEKLCVRPCMRLIETGRLLWSSDGLLKRNAALSSAIMKYSFCALPPGSPAPTIAEFEARIAALEQEVKKHKQQIAALENSA